MINLKLKNIGDFFVNSKYAFLIAILFIFLCGYSIFTSFDSTSNIENSQSVNITLVTNKVIVLDAGHGNPDLRSYWI